MLLKHWFSAVDITMAIIWTKSSYLWVFVTNFSKFDLNREQSRSFFCFIILQEEVWCYWGGHISINIGIVQTKTALMNWLNFLTFYPFFNLFWSFTLSQTNTNKFGPGGVFAIPKLKPLNSAKQCYECGEEFSLFKQKYHCRNCGKYTKIRNE